MMVVDSLVSVHDLSVFNFPDMTSLSKSRGATHFSVDVMRQTSLTGETAVMVRLCVVVKRKLQLYYWKNREFREFGPDLSLPDVPRSVSWCRETLCLAFKVIFYIRLSPKNELSGSKRFASLVHLKSPVKISEPAQK